MATVAGTVAVTVASAASVGVAMGVAGSVATTGVAGGTGMGMEVEAGEGPAVGAEAGVAAAGSGVRYSSHAYCNRSGPCQRRSTSSPTPVRRRRNARWSSCPPCRKSKSPCQMGGFHTRGCVVAVASERVVAGAAASERGVAPLEAVPTAASLAASVETRRGVRA